MTIRVLLAAAAATVSLVACGGEDPQPASSSSDRQAQNRKALLDFARCMRENGVDMPDPQFQGGGRVMQRGPGNVDRDTLRKAEQACAKYRESVKPPELSEADREQFRKAALEHARCMREQGIANFPDPQFDSNGGAQIRIGPGSGVDPESPKFRDAQEACADKMPRLGRTRGEQ